MIVRFRHEFALPVDEVYTYFRSPADWPRIFGLSSEVEDHGEVRFTEKPTGVMVEGFEEVAISGLGFLSPPIERLFLERRFRAVGDVGWHRLRKREAAGALRSI